MGIAFILILVWLILVWIQGVVIIKVAAEEARDFPDFARASIPIYFSGAALRLFLIGAALLTLLGTRWRHAPVLGAVAILYNLPIAPHLEGLLLSLVDPLAQPFQLRLELIFGLSGLISISAASYLIFSKRVRRTYDDAKFRARSHDLPKSRPPSA